ncbi:hypothetical protein ACODNH_23595 (plasmid) [Haloarcula sp. NS06]
MGNDEDSGGSSGDDPENKPLLEGQLITNSDDDDIEIGESDTNE